MAFGPIALTIPQYEDYPNNWLKAYSQGTTTPLNMATDATGATTLVKAELDTQGFPITAGGARFIPFIDGDYDLWLFPTEEEADADITVNAIQFADNLNTDTAGTLRADLASTASSKGAELVGYINDLTGAVATTVDAKLQSIHSINDWNPNADGITDDYAVFAAAFTAMKNTGDILWIPSDNYLIDTDGGSLEIEGFALVGPGTYSAITPVTWGAVFSLTGTTNEAFSIGRGGQIRGCNFYYPDQVTTNPPTVYPTTLLFDYSLSAINSGNVQGVVIEDCTFFNPYIAIDIGPSGTGSSQGNARIRNNRFYSLNKGIIVRDTLTNLYVTDNTWSPEFWQDSVSQAVRTYVALNASVIEYIDGDNLQFTNNTMFAYGFGINYSNGTGAGNAIFQTIGFNIFDSVRRGIYAEGASIPQGANIVGNMFAAKNFGDATDFGCRGIFISETTDVLKIIVSGNRFAPTAGNHIQIDDSAGTQTGMVTIDNNQYEFAGFGDATSTNYFSNVINAASMDFTITDSHYRQTNRTDNIGTKIFDAQSLTISNNKYDSCDQAVVVDACDYLQLTGNWSRNTQDATASYSVGVVTNDAVIGQNQFDKQPNAINLTADSATPSVANGQLFKEAYTVATDITGFTDCRKNKTFKIVFNTGNITIKFSTTATLKGNSNADWITVDGDSCEVTYDGTNYYFTINDAT